MIPRFKIKYDPMYEYICFQVYIRQWWGWRFLAGYQTREMARAAITKIMDEKTEYVW